MIRKEKPGYEKSDGGGEGAAEIDYKGMRPDNIDELARAAAKVKTTIHV